MKTRIVHYFVPLLFGSFIFAVPCLANNGEPKEDMTESEKTKKIERLESRADVLESQIMDLRVARKEATSASDRRALRKEARELKSELNAVMAEGKALNGGIYIGSGALIAILIILLLL